MHHERFHGILPEEHSGTFYELPWGLHKGMFTDAQGQSDIVIYKTNIWNKVYLCKQTFVYTYNVFEIAHRSPGPTTNLMRIRFVSNRPRPEEVLWPESGWRRCPLSSNFLGVMQHDVLLISVLWNACIQCCTSWQWFFRSYKLIILTHEGFYRPEDRSLLKWPEDRSLLKMSETASIILALLTSSLSEM